MEPSPDNTVCLSYSDDQGTTFAAPTAMAAPKEGTRCFDPTLWIDPLGRLWYIFNRGNKDTATHNVHARICENPDASKPTWSEEIRINYDAPYAFRMNKPTVLSTGEWIMPVTHAAEPIRAWFAGPKQRQGVGISTDQGRTWKLHGSLKAPEWALECMITELRDGRLWMLLRTGSGVLWQSHSTDKGLTWSEANASTIPNPGARFFIRRLASGNLLLVNHYKNKGRSHLTARVSTDDGTTWNEGLLLDERANVSYPDGVQDKDGLIWITYDRDRQGDSEILLAKFREEDAMTGKNTSGAVSLRQTVNKLEKPKFIPPSWNPKEAADRVLAGMINTSAPQVKGAHDAEFVCVGEHAYIVAEVNDVKPGEGGDWNFIYSALSIVNVKTMTLEKVIPMARGEQVFANETLPFGNCFVPRIIQKDEHTLRCYFASEEPKKRQAQTWYIDFDLATQTFHNEIQRLKLKTAAGTFDMQPQHFYNDAAAHGFSRPQRDYGMYLFDSFKPIQGKTYVAINNYVGGQNALALLNPGLDTVEVLGHYNEPADLMLTESAVNRLPDGTWLAIVRQESGNTNYTFSTSKDGRTWTPNGHRDFVRNGASAKPTFDRFGDLYYLGWQEATKVNGVNRSVFNIEVSRDGTYWERKYRFETEKSFQYPTFHEHNGTVYLTVTQGDTDPSRKERIMFGKLE
jgi:predicted neuraminidase